MNATTEGMPCETHRPIVVYEDVHVMNSKH